MINAETESSSKSNSSYSSSDEEFDHADVSQQVACCFCILLLVDIKLTVNKWSSRKSVVFGSLVCVYYLE